MAKVTVGELQSHFEHYQELAQREPVSVTDNGKESLVLLSADEYRRLKAIDTRQAFYVHSLPDDILAELEGGYQGEPTPYLDYLMK